ncbi:MAG: T9SS type A sorting domain-containing protein [Ignavibacteria bacterium]|nr:T9SS type A sorting domain-containing protein [Ignavibacteria bacterium]
MNTAIQNKNRNKVFYYINFLMILILSASLKAQTNYEMTLENGIYADNKTMEFEIYISASGENINLVSYQCILSFNQEIKNGGELTFSYIDESSQLENFPLVVCISNIDGQDEMSIGSNVGNDLITSVPLRIGKFRLSNSNPFNSDDININWDFSGNNFTVIFSAPFSDITNTENHIELSEPSPLPVELSLFTASADANSVNLMWQTQTEVNNYGFEIERSVDSEKWENIGFVKGNGNSNTQLSYSFKDVNPKGALNFVYRLKQIDIDGSFEYSQNVNAALNINSYELFQNYPNPFNPQTTIKFALLKQSEVILSVYNILGEKVYDLINNKLEAGIHNIEFNASSLASGTYIYRLEVKNQFVSVKKMILLK